MRDSPKPRLSEHDQRLEASAIAAKSGDRDAMTEVWEAAVSVCYCIAGKYGAKYEWVCRDDLAQNLLTKIPGILNCYDSENSAGNNWTKYAYFRLDFSARDELRALDPLGISWPAKKVYPKFSRLGDPEFNFFELHDPASELHVADTLADDCQTATQHSPANADLRYLLETLAPDRFTATGRFTKRKPIRIRINGGRLVDQLGRKKCRPKKKTKRSLTHFINERGAEKMTTEADQYVTPVEQPVAPEAVSLPVVQPGAPVDEPEQTQAPEPVSLPARNRKPDRSAAGRIGAAARWAGKPKTKTKRVRRPKAVTASEPESDALRLLGVAQTFIYAAGGMKKAQQLLEQLAAMK